MLEKIGCISEVNIGWVALAVAGDSEQQKLSRLDLSALLTESLCSRRSADTQDPVSQHLDATAQSRRIRDLLVR